MKQKHTKFRTIIVLILFSAIYCRAGLFDKLDNAINTANPFANTNVPVQENATNPPDQNSEVTATNTVETPQPSTAAAIPQTNSVESQAEQNANASSEKIKAYKTLNFGDNTKTVNDKLRQILGNDPSDIILPDSGMVNRSETFWRSLFDTDAEYEPYKFDGTQSSQSDKLESLMNYFSGQLSVTMYSDANSAISVGCYQLNDSTGGSLAVVEVSYKIFDPDKLADGFMQNYPNAQKEIKSGKIEDVVYPGVSLEFQRTFFSDINSNRRATLSIPSKKMTFTFTDLSKLSQDQLAVWNSGMTQAGKTDMNEFFESVKNSLLELAKNIDSDEATNLTLDPLTAQSWNDYKSIIYRAPHAVFASKQILDPIVNNYLQSIEAADQAEKAKLKKESESSSGF